MNESLLRELTQSIIAIVVVLGGGLLLAVAPTALPREGVFGAIGVVLGYYFAKNGMSQAIKAAQQQNS